MTPVEPKVKNAIVFVDGQNLYRAAKDAFGYNYPNYDIKLLSEKVCSSQVWHLTDIYFYTGVPDSQDDAFWHNFWSKKLSYMGRLGIKLFSRSLRYHNEDFACPSCNKNYTSLVGYEKGVDVRIALDVIRLAHEKKYDVAVILSQDQDLSEVADEVRRISIEQKRWIKIVSAFPISPTKKDGYVDGLVDGLRFAKLIPKNVSRLEAFGELEKYYLNNPHEKNRPIVEVLLEKYKN